MATATVQVNVRIDPTLYAAIKRASEALGTTVTNVVAVALEEYVATRPTDRGEKTK